MQNACCAYIFRAVSRVHRRDQSEDDRSIHSLDNARRKSVRSPFDCKDGHLRAEFDLEQWLSTLERLRAERFDRLYPTHFGAVDDVDAHLTRVEDALRAHTAFVLDHRAAGADRAAIVAAYGPWFLADAERHSVPESYHGFYVKDSLTEMNVTGILRYDDQRESSTAGPTS